MKSVHHREPQLVEGGMSSLKEWASEGESKIVDETERILRYQTEHMIVCDERMRICIKPGGTAGDDTLVPAIWDRSFFVRAMSQARLFQSRPSKEGQAVSLLARLHFLTRG